jgi:hypothetical protein
MLALLLLAVTPQIAAAGGFGAIVAAHYCDDDGGGAAAIASGASMTSSAAPASDRHAFGDSNGKLGADCCACPQCSVAMVMPSVLSVPRAFAQLHGPIAAVIRAVPDGIQVDPALRPPCTAA